ncbi:uncharacterized protein [Clytia hemisphaerica]
MIPCNMMKHARKPNSKHPYRFLNLSDGWNKQTDSGFMESSTQGATVGEGDEEEGFINCFDEQTVNLQLPLRDVNQDFVQKMKKEDGAVEINLEKRMQEMEVVLNSLETDIERVNTKIEKKTKNIHWYNLYKRFRVRTLKGRLDNMNIKKREAKLVLDLIDAFVNPQKRTQSRGWGSIVKSEILLPDDV